MTIAIVLYSLLLLVALITCIYTLWCYYECPATKSHRPYVFPIFISAGWFILAINGLLAQVAQTHGAPDGYSFIMLAVATIVALLIFTSYYRKCRHEAQ